MPKKTSDIHPLRHWTFPSNNIGMHSLVARMSLEVLTILHADGLAESRVGGS